MGLLDRLEQRETETAPAQSKSTGLLARLESKKAPVEEPVIAQPETAVAEEVMATQPEDIKASNPRQRRAKLARAEAAASEEEFLSSLSPERRALLESISPMEAALIGTGRGFMDVGRGVGLVDPADEGEIEAFKQLEEVQPLASVGQVIGQAAPFVPAGVGAAGIASTPLRVGATGLLGGTEAAVLTKGQGGTIGETIQAAGIGSTVASALELGLPVIGRAGGKVIRRVLGKTPKGAVVDSAGNPSDELITALDKAGLTYDDLVDDSINQLRVRAVDADQAAREGLLRSQGLEPTRAQVTRDAADFQAQQEAAKTSTKVRDALEKQEAFLSSRFDNEVLGTGGQTGNVNSVAESLISKATVLDDEIGRLYKLAREAVPADKNVRLGSLSAKLKELAPSDRRAGGNISAVVGDLQAKGVLDDKLKVVGRIDVESAEDVRMLMNELFDPSNPFGNMKLRELKETLDNDVFRAAGRDVFEEARKAKSDFEKGLSRAKIAKFDSRKDNLVRDVLENKIDPDQLVDKVVLSKRWRPSDLKQLKDYISDTDEGLAAFNDLRADVLQTIKEKSFIGPQDAQGMQALSADKLEKALKQIGPKKLEILFDETEQKFLKDMLKVSRLREPVRGTAIGKGPSAQAIQGLRSQIAKGDGILLNILDAVTPDPKGKAVLKALPKEKIPYTGSIARVPLALSSGAATAETTNQNQ